MTSSVDPRDRAYPDRPGVYIMKDADDRTIYVGKARALRDRVRKQEKPGRPRRTASIDSQSVDTSSGGEARGRDNAKNVSGRKRHIIVDSLGLLLAVVVTAADVDDAAAAPAALRQLAEQVGHHPDIYLAWGKVRVTVWTHKINGLAEADFVFAAKVDALP